MNAADFVLLCFNFFAQCEEAPAVETGDPTRGVN